MSGNKRDADTFLGQPLDLPCGVRLKNRMIKAAMSDSLGDGQGNATNAQMRLYERWAEGGAALSLIGEVQTSPYYPEKPGNLVLSADADTSALRSIAVRGSANGAQIWPQLGHAGALSHGPISQPAGPSALNIEGLQCAEMSSKEIGELPNIYSQAAAMAKEIGFGGVQIHAGHGFLFSQFLSPLFNHRTDGYGGSVNQRFRIIGETLTAVRNAVGASYPIGIKINSTDQLEGGLTEEDGLEIVRLLQKTSVDLIDVSGGTYFPGAPSSSDKKTASGPYFLDFAKRAKAIITKPILLTGGFQTRDQALSALMSEAADAVGLARAMVIDPSLPNAWLSGQGGDPKFPIFDAPPSGSVTAWYSMRLTALGEETEAAFDANPSAALAAYLARDARRCPRWLQRFSQ